MAAWVKAQNEGSFDAYAAFYADEFEGVKRVGKTATTMKRDAWLADRKKMFAKPMKVHAGAGTVSVDAAGTVITFQQTWQQGEFADRGPKRMHWVSTPAGYRIVREELLSSRVIPTEDSCVRAMLPEVAPSKRRVSAEPDADGITQVLILDVDGPRFLCALDTRPAEVEEGQEVMGEWLLAVVERRKTWRVVAELGSFVYPLLLGDVVSKRATAELSAVAISDTESAALLELVEVSEQPGSSDRKTMSRLLRLGPKGVEELLSFSSESSAGEVDTGDVRKLEVTARKHRGFYDLKVVHTVYKDEWPTNTHEKESDATLYEWDGTTYVER